MDDQKRDVQANTVSEEAVGAAVSSGGETVGAGISRREKGMATALVAIALIGLVVLSALWLVLLLAVRDGEVADYFVYDSAMPAVFYGFLIAFGVILALFLLLLRKMPPPRLQDGLPTLFFSSAGSGILLLAYGVVLLCVSHTYATFPAGYAVAAVLAILTAAGFFLKIAPEGLLPARIYRLLTVIAGLCGVFFALAYAMTGYFDTSLPINSPLKWMDQLFFIVLAFFLLYETGLRVDRRRFGAYTVFAAATFVLGTVNALGGIVLFLVNNEVLHGTVLHDFLQLGLALYAVVRLVSAVACANARESYLLSTISEEAVQHVEEAEKRREESSRILSERLTGIEEKETESEDGYVQEKMDFSAVESTASKDNGGEDKA